MSRHNRREVFSPAREGATHTQGICPKCGSLEDYLLPEQMCYGCAFVEELRTHLKQDWSRYGTLKREYADLARQLEEIRINLRHDEATLRKALEKREVRREASRRRRSLKGCQ